MERLPESELLLQNSRRIVPGGRESNQEESIAESLFIAGQFVLAANGLAGIVRLLGGDDDAGRLDGAAKAMTSTIGEHGWDGGWFLRAYDAFGDPVGSKSNEVEAFF